MSLGFFPLQINQSTSLHQVCQPPDTKATTLTAKLWPPSPSLPGQRVQRQEPFQCCEDASLDRDYRQVSSNGKGICAWCTHGLEKIRPNLPAKSQHPAVDIL